MDGILIVDKIGYPVLRVDFDSFLRCKDSNLVVVMRSESTGFLLLIGELDVVSAFVTLGLSVSRRRRGNGRPFSFHLLILDPFARSVNS